MDEPPLDGQAPAERTPDAEPESGDVLPALKKAAGEDPQPESRDDGTCQELRHAGIDDAVENWQRQLLQLNRRNNLLYFKGNPNPADDQSRRRTTLRCIPLVDFSPDEIDEYLQGTRKGRTFDYAARRTRDAEAQQSSDSSGEVSDDVEVVSGNLKTDVDPLALQRVLLRFFRKEREWLEEQGINILFLAVGFLEWIDEEDEKAKSPLLLLPCDLTRSSPRDPFVLHREDDDAAINATLRHKLHEFGIELPEFEHESYSEYLAVVSHLITDRPGWDVTHEVVLATFQYTKLAMWEDLSGMRNEGVNHPLVRRLAGETPPDAWSSVTDDTAFPPESELAGGRLDDFPEIRRTASVLPADHSQLRAVCGCRLWKEPSHPRATRNRQESDHRQHNCQPDVAR